MTRITLCFVTVPCSHHAATWHLLPTSSINHGSTLLEVMELPPPPQKKKRKRNQQLDPSLSPTSSSGNVAPAIRSSAMTGWLRYCVSSRKGMSPPESTMPEKRKRKRSRATRQLVRSLAGRFGTVGWKGQRILFF